MPSMQLHKRRKVNWLWLPKDLTADSMSASTVVRGLRYTSYWAMWYISEQTCKSVEESLHGICAVRRDLTATWKIACHFDSGWRFLSFSAFVSQQPMVRVWEWSSEISPPSWSRLKSPAIFLVEERAMVLKPEISKTTHISVITCGPIPDFTN